MLDGKKYIGKTIQPLANRRKAHERDAKKGSELYLHRAMRKYGLGVFKWKVICVVKNKEELSSLEIAHIQQLKTKIPNGCNLTDGGEGTLGRKCRQETKDKIGNGNRGKACSSETRALLSKQNKGKKHSLETRIKIGLSNKGKHGEPVPESVRLKISKTLQGRSPSEETRKKLSIARMGHSVSDETRRKISLAQKGIPRQKGRKFSEETKQRMSIAAKKRVKTEAGKLQIKQAILASSEAQKGKKQSLERRMIQSRRVKESWKNPEYRAKHIAAMRRQPIKLVA